MERGRRGNGRGGGRGRGGRGQGTANPQFQGQPRGGGGGRGGGGEHFSQQPPRGAWGSEPPQQPETQPRPQQQQQPWQQPRPQQQQQPWQQPRPQQQQQQQHQQAWQQPRPQQQQQQPQQQQSAWQPRPPRIAQPQPQPQPQPPPQPEQHRGSTPPSGTGPSVSDTITQVRSLTLTEPGSSSSSAVQKTSSSQALVPLRRPDRGGTLKPGGEVRLLTNFFKVNFNSGLRILHYDLDIQKVNGKNGKSGSSKQQANKPTSFSREVATEIMNALVKENSTAFVGKPWVFDGRKNLYSCQNLPEGTFTVRLQRDKESAPKEFKVKISYTGHELNGNSLLKYLNVDGKDFNHMDMPQDMFQALDLVFRQHPGMSRILIGRSLYSSALSNDMNLGRGITASRGFYMSVRPTAMGLCLNLDLSVVAFHKPISVLDYLKEKCRGFSPDRGMDPRLKAEVERTLKGLKVSVTHRRCSQKFVIRALTKDRVQDIKFSMDEGHGGTMQNLVGYFKSKHNASVRYPQLPGLDLSKDKTRPNYVPMEFCALCAGQRYSRDALDGNQQKNFGFIACPKASERQRAIESIMTSRDGPCGGDYPGKYGMTLSKDMVSVVGRILDAPELKLRGSGGRHTVLTPEARQDRQWNLMRSQVFQGSNINCWALMCSTGNAPDQQRQNMVHQFGYQLACRCTQIGIPMAERPGDVRFRNIANLTNEATVHNELSEMKRNLQGRLQLLICIIDGKHPGYNTLKLVAETRVGVVTQCCLLSGVEKCFYFGQGGPPQYDDRRGSQYLANLGLKINAKIGGCNTALSQNLSRYIPRIGNSSVMLMGADVNHPNAGDKKSPSISALVGSINDLHTNYEARINYQKHRKEHIVDLDQMAEELLNAYQRANRKLPERIIFFRDGVSESQFNMALNEELILLKQAVNRFPNYSPKVTLIVAQKRHHTRLFVADGEKATKSGNPPPGTVVDTTIIHPRCYDFYICSHNGLLGTSKPTHYTVLYDENGFMSNEVQVLINNLCYTFARCTKPVSLVPPVYYADLAAYRGRQYIQGSVSETASTVSSESSSSSDLSAFAGLKLHEQIKNSMFFC